MIFLTTLGVYLGLVLAGGASPQVFAHTALTRNFDIRDEIEFKDDLDNKPDDEHAIEEFTSSFLDLYQVILDASVANPEGIEKGQYDFVQFLTVNSGGGSRAVFPGDLNPGPKISLGRARAPLYRAYDAFLRSSREPNNRFRIDFTITPTDVTYGVTVAKASPEIAKSAMTVYVASLETRKQLESVLLKSLLYNATEISINGEKIAIVTHLPRASIDPLLAERQAQ